MQRPDGVMRDPKTFTEGERNALTVYRQRLNDRTLSKEEHDEARERIREIETLGVGGRISLLEELVNEQGQALERIENMLQAIVQGEPVEAGKKHAAPKPKKQPPAPAKKSKPAKKKTKAADTTPTQSDTPNSQSTGLTGDEAESPDPTVADVSGSEEKPVDARLQELLRNEEIGKQEEEAQRDVNEDLYVAASNKEVASRTCSSNRVSRGEGPAPTAPKADWLNDMEVDPTELYVDPETGEKAERIG